MDAKKVSSVSQADSYEAIGKFWNDHDFTDFDDLHEPDVDFEITCAVPIDIELLTAIESQAHKRGVQVETLVNLWLQQKLTEQGQLILA
ncbi:MAG TPA: CopG family antitoxin [Anaerolineae bacterium]|nr:CopG family antitoxin [Anaerolineae bacterium]